MGILSNKFKEKLNNKVSLSIKKESGKSFKEEFKKHVVHVYGMLLISVFLILFFIYLMSKGFSDSLSNSSLLNLLLVTLFLVLFLIGEFKYRIHMLEDELVISRLFFSRKIEYRKIERVELMGDRVRIYDGTGLFDYEEIGMELVEPNLFLRQLKDSLPFEDNVPSSSSRYISKYKVKKLAKTDF
jgi:hypothetical protein